MQRSLQQFVLLFTIGALAALMSSAAAQEVPKPLRYLRPAKDRLVLESAVTETRTADGTTYVSLTDRGSEKMTLRVRFGKDGQVTGAEAIQETAQGKQQATVSFVDGKARVTRAGGMTDMTAAGPNAVVTTAPDWSDIFLLVRRYDAKKGGRQEFPGLWIHPSKPTLVLSFFAERLGSDPITVGDKKLSLERYRIRLRSGDYLVWADAAFKVVKLFPEGKPAAFVVLEGYEEATRALGS